MGGKKAKAADVQKQMESWMKQNNKKKEKPMSKEEADALRYEQFPNFEKSPKMTTRGQKICFRARFKIITLKSSQKSRTLTSRVKDVLYQEHARYDSLPII